MTGLLALPKFLLTFSITVTSERLQASKFSSKQHKQPHVEDLISGTQKGIDGANKVQVNDRKR